MLHAGVFPLRSRDLSQPLAPIASEEHRCELGHRLAPDELLYGKAGDGHHRRASVLQLRELERLHVADVREEGDAGRPHWPLAVFPVEDELARGPLRPLAGSDAERVEAEVAVRVRVLGRDLEERKTA